MSYASFTGNTGPLTFKPSPITWSVFFASETAALNARTNALALATVSSAKVERRADGWYLIIVEETF